MSKKTNKSSKAVKNINLTLTTAKRTALKKKSTEVPSGRINGTGKGTTEEQRAELRKLRQKDPQTYTLRRLALIYGLDPGTVYYILKPTARAQQAEAREKAAKAKARKRSSKSTSKKAA